MLESCDLKAVLHQYYTIDLLNIIHKSHMWKEGFFKPIRQVVGEPIFYDFRDNDYYIPVLPQSVWESLQILKILRFSLFSIMK